MAPIAIFGYASLVSPQSAARTLGRAARGWTPARLEGWVRRWSQKRDNLTCEKTFALADGGRTPRWVLGLNVERGGSAAEAPNGAMFEIEPSELSRLDRREIRYERVDVTDQVHPTAVSGGEPEVPRFERIYTYTARAGHFAPEPPPDAVILAAYARTVESAFAALGEAERRAYLETTGPYPVEVVEGVLVRDEIPPGNPRDW